MQTTPKFALAVSAGICPFAAPGTGLLGLRLHRPLAALNPCIHVQLSFFQAG
jgi:hypothetical protein